MRLSSLLLATVLLASPILAGCIGTKDKGTTQPATNGLSQASLPTASDLPPKPPRTQLVANVTASAVWVQPGDSVKLTATAPGAATFAWYLQLRAPIVAPAAGGSCVHRASATSDADALCILPSTGSRSDTSSCASALLDPGACNAPPPSPTTPKLDTGTIPPGESKTVKLDKPGLYMLHCHPHPWMTVNLTVAPNAPAGDKTVSIVDGAATSDYRFAPEDVTVAPGSIVTFANQGQQVHTATMHTFLIPISATGKEPTYKTEAPGDYDVVLLARDAGTGVGIARTRLFVDPAKPSELQPIGPYKGTFNAGAPVPNNPQAESKDFSFTLNFPTKSLVVNLTSASQTPVPTMIHATLKKQGDSSPAASMTSADKGAITLGALTEGVYTLTITADQGALIDYVASGYAVYDLSPPASSAAASTMSGHKM